MQRDMIIGALTDLHVHHVNDRRECMQWHLQVIELEVVRCVPYLKRDDGAAPSVVDLLTRTTDNILIVDLFYLLGGSKVGYILDRNILKDRLDATRFASSEFQNQHGSIGQITRSCSLSPAANEYLVALAVVIVGLRHHSLLLLQLLLMLS